MEIEAGLSNNSSIGTERCNRFACYSTDLPPALESVIVIIESGFKC